MKEKTKQEGNLNRKTTSMGTNLLILLSGMVLCINTILVEAEAAAQSDASECEKGQYFEDAIRLCLPCHDKCQPDGIPKLCPLSCKGWNLTTPTAKCPKGYVWSEAIGRCSKCSITCSQVGEHKCPLECDGWLVKKIPRPTNKTKGPNPKNSGETLNKRISKDKKAGHPGLYALVIPAIVLVIGGGVAVRKLKKDQRASGPQGGRELQPLNNQGNNPDIENQVLENPTANKASYNPENAGGNEETRVHGQPDDADNTPCVL